MIFQHFLLAECNEVNMYLVACEETREAAVIDAGSADPRVMDFVRANGLRVTKLILTHGHWDHIDGAQYYLDHFRCELVIPDLFKPQSKKPNALDVSKATRVAESGVVGVGNLELRGFYVTGHTPDLMCFHIAGEETLFDGDALFAGSIGGTSTDALKQEQVTLIRDKIFTLPDSTIVYSGHGPATTIGVEKAFNPFFN